MGANCPKMSNYWDSSAILSEIVHFLYALTGVYHLVALLTVLMPIHTPDSIGKKWGICTRSFWGTTHRRLHHLKWLWCLINLQFFQICQPLISPSRFKANRWSQWWNRTHNIRRKYLRTSLGSIRVLWLHSQITVLRYYLWTFRNHVLFSNDLWSEPCFFLLKGCFERWKRLRFLDPIRCIRNRR